MKKKGGGGITCMVHEGGYCSRSNKTLYYAVYVRLHSLRGLNIIHQHHVQSLATFMRG